jgi:hypothetical protein
MIDPNIWQSEDFSKLSYFARLLFIGMFSNADDYGYGRAKSAYLKSIIFPYADEKLKTSAVDKALTEISNCMSIVFYEVDGNEYYLLLNWDKWQRVDKPSESQIPQYSDDVKRIRLPFGENSPNVQRSVDPSIREVSIREVKGREVSDEDRSQKFEPPSLEDVTAYCQLRKNHVSPQRFIDFYSSKGWMIGKNKMKDWRAAVRTWEQKDGDAGRN